MSKNTYFYLPVEPGVVTSKDVLEFFGEKFKSDESGLFDEIKLKPDSWGYHDNKTGMHRFIIDSNSGSETEFMVLSEINEDVFGLSGDSRDSWLRIRLGRADAVLGKAMTELTKKMDGWCAPNSKAFIRPITGDSLYLLLGGEQAIKEYDRSKMVTVLNTLGNNSETLNASLISDDQLIREVAKTLKIEAVITDKGNVKVPIRKSPEIKWDKDTPGL